MQFRVGPFDYTVRQVAGFIRHDGQDCLGLCDNVRQELLISDRSSPAQQVQVLCHEYMEAWLYHFGSGLTDKESYCDLFGVAMTQFVLDFVRDMKPMLRDQAAAVVESLLTPAQPPEPPEPPEAPAATESRTTRERFRITRIYEPAPAGSPTPWLMTLVAPAEPVKTQEPRP